MTLTADQQMARMISEFVGGLTGNTSEAMFGKARGVTPVVRARQVSMYLAHICCSYSLARVGLLFGRDKSTVGHAVHAIEDLRDDAEFDDWMCGLEEAVDVMVRLTPNTSTLLSGLWNSQDDQPTVASLR